MNRTSINTMRVILPFRMPDIVYTVLLIIIITLKYSSSQLTDTTTSCDNKYYVEVINDLRDEVAILQNRMTQVLSLLTPVETYTNSATGCACLNDTTKTDCACCNNGGCQCPYYSKGQCVKCGDEQLLCGAQDIYTKSSTGCPCYFDLTRNDCACCTKEGCQCPSGSEHQCVRCNDAANCYNRDMYTKITTGCQCYWDASRYDCACCYPGGCQCPQANKNQCVVCGDGALCGKRDGYTKMTQGCQCYFNNSRYDCACCNPGGCQCAIDHPHQCVKCADSFMCEKSDWFTKSSTGCQCYWDTSRYDCACCFNGGCQCPQANKNQCVVCGDGGMCGKVCPLQFTYFRETNHCFLVSLNVTDWQSSRLACEQINPRAHLVVIQDQAKSRSIDLFLSSLNRIQLIEEGRAFYTAAQWINPTSQSRFVWKPDNRNWSEMTYASWIQGEPNNYQNWTEACVEASFENLLMNDVRCSEPHCFFCEIDMI